MPAMALESWDWEMEFRDWWKYLDWCSVLEYALALKSTNHKRNNPGWWRRKRGKAEQVNSLFLYYLQKLMSSV